MTNDFKIGDIVIVKQRFICKSEDEVWVTNDMKELRGKTFTIEKMDDRGYIIYDYRYWHPRWLKKVKI